MMRSLRATLVALLACIACGTVDAQPAQPPTEKPTISRAVVQEIIRKFVDSVSDQRMKYLGIKLTDPEKEELAESMLKSMEDAGVYTFGP